MITAKVISPCIVNGETTPEGEVVSVDETTFERLAGAGCLEKTTEKAPKPETKEPVQKEMKTPKDKQMKSVKNK